MEIIRIVTPYDVDLILLDKAGITEPVHIIWVRAGMIAFVHANYIEAALQQVGCWMKLERPMVSCPRPSVLWEQASRDVPDWLPGDESHDERYYTPEQ